MFSSSFSGQSEWIDINSREYNCSYMVSVQLLYSDCQLTVRLSGTEDLLQKLINPLKPELNPICYLLALLGTHHFLHVSRIRVQLLTLR